MESYKTKANSIALCVLLATPFDSSSVEHPNVTTKDFSSPFGCFNESAILERTRGVLVAHAQRSAKPHVSSVQKLHNQINGEIEYYLEHLKWKVVQRLSKEHSKFVVRGSFEFYFAEVGHTIRRFVFLQSDVNETLLKKEVRRSLRNLLERVFPAAFLCLPMGACKSPSSAYSECLAENAASWQKAFFGADLQAVARKVAVLVLRLRNVQRAAEELHAMLLQAPENLDEAAFGAFAEARFCETVVFCPKECVARAKTCFRTVGDLWAKKLFQVQQLVKNFGKGFAEIEDDIVNIFLSRKARRSTTVAELVFKKCGPLRRAREVPKGDIFFLQEREEPTVVLQGTVLHVEKLVNASLNLWSRAAEDLCPTELAPKQQCFDGTHFVTPSHPTQNPVHTHLRPQGLFTASIYYPPYPQEKTKSCHCIRWIEIPLVDPKVHEMSHRVWEQLIRNHYKAVVFDQSTQNLRSDLIRLDRFLHRNHRYHAFHLRFSLAATCAELSSFGSLTGKVP
uniref:DUF4461 domain-containing protein n=1 Tax=Steinernema glaseri TaxID=37863 RepID=A0A1I8AFU5_9BILA